MSAGVYVCVGVTLREREGEYACVVNDETGTHIQNYDDSLLHYECSGPQHSCNIMFSVPSQEFLLRDCLEEHSCFLSYALCKCENLTHCHCSLCCSNFLTHSLFFNLSGLVFFSIFLFYIDLSVELLVEIRLLILIFHMWWRI